MEPVVDIDPNEPADIIPLPDNDDGGGDPRGESLITTEHESDGSYNYQQQQERQQQQRDESKSRQMARTGLALLSTPPIIHHQQHSSSLLSSLLSPSLSSSSSSSSSSFPSFSYPNASFNHHQRVDEREDGDREEEGEKKEANGDDDEEEEVMELKSARNNREVSAPKRSRSNAITPTSEPSSSSSSSIHFRFIFDKDSHASKLFRFATMYQGLVRIIEAQDVWNPLLVDEKSFVEYMKGYVNRRGEVDQEHPSEVLNRCFAQPLPSFVQSQGLDLNRRYEHSGSDLSTFTILQHVLDNRTYTAFAHYCAIQFADSGMLTKSAWAHQSRVYIVQRWKTIAQNEYAKIAGEEIITS